MKKLINTSFAYLILAFIGGVFYREFTKFNGFDGATTLSVVHTHLLILGVLFFLLLALFVKNYPTLNLSRFYIFYNISLIFFMIMLIVRGIVQVLGVDVSTGLNASISGFAGISHIALSVSLIYLFVLLKKEIQ